VDLGSRRAAVPRKSRQNQEDPELFDETKTFEVDYNTRKAQLKCFRDVSSGYIILDLEGAQIAGAETWPESALYRFDRDTLSFNENICFRSPADFDAFKKIHHQLSIGSEEAIAEEERLGPVKVKQLSNIECKPKEIDEDSWGTDRDSENLDEIEMVMENEDLELDMSMMRDNKMN
jgi:hypothetical protein